LTSSPFIRICDWYMKYWFYSFWSWNPAEIMIKVKCKTCDYYNICLEDHFAKVDEGIPCVSYTKNGNWICLEDKEIIAEWTGEAPARLILEF